MFWFIILQAPGSALWKDCLCPFFFLATPEVALEEYDPTGGSKSFVPWFPPLNFEGPKDWVDAVTVRYF